MSSYQERFIEFLIKRMKSDMVARVDSLVARSTEARDVEYQRGYIACLKDYLTQNIDDIKSEVDKL